jgi:hypothetical protein
MPFMIFKGQRIVLQYVFLQIVEALAGALVPEVARNFSKRKRRRRHKRHRIRSSKKC